jgi:hypothetical protein
VAQVALNYVEQDGLKLVILLLQPPQCWDNKGTPPYLVVCDNLSAILEKHKHKPGVMAQAYNPSYLGD